MTFDWDDFGCNHIISGMTQSGDCRSVLLQLKKLNPAFKCTLFAIPGEMTREMLEWSRNNGDWIELGVHGFYHTSNWECHKIETEEFDNLMLDFEDMIEDYFAKVFRAPGWQISDDAIEWLHDNDWILADQSYNDDRRPAHMNAYINANGVFTASPKVGNPIAVNAYHGHVWDVGEKGNEPNGIYEDFAKVEELVKGTDNFKFVSELFPS